MKTSVFLVLILELWASGVTYSQELHMMGGVDVGNGGRVVAGMIEGFFKTEDELVFQIKNTVGEVRSGQHDRVRQWIRQGRCNADMEFDSTDVIISYREINGKWTRGVLGYTKILLEECLDPYAIEADEHPSEENFGDEVWYNRDRNSTESGDQ